MYTNCNQSNKLNNNSSPFLPGKQTKISAIDSGPLDGLTFGVKDLIDIKGQKTGCGNPDWLSSTFEAAHSAPCVDILLNSGASLIGKTITDEFAFSLEGINEYYGTPTNPYCLDRVPGGSSSGSASLVALGLADFALGTDTGGSVRIPAAFCGLYGLRPTHGAISLKGTMEFSPSYDTIGLLAREIETLQLTSETLLPFTQNKSSFPLSNLVLASDAFELASENIRFFLLELANLFISSEGMNVFDGDPSLWLTNYQIIQGREIWESIGKRLIDNGIALSNKISERFRFCELIDDESVVTAEIFKETAKQQLAKKIPYDGAIVIPTSPNIALKKLSSDSEIEAFYQRALTLNSLAGHAGLPQVCIPVGKVDGCPISLSLVGHVGDDIRLIATAKEIARIICSKNPLDKEK